MNPKCINSMDCCCRSAVSIKKNDAPETSCCGNVLRMPHTLPGAEFWKGKIRIRGGEHRKTSATTKDPCCRVMVLWGKTDGYKKCQLHCRKTYRNKSGKQGEATISIIMIVISSTTTTTTTTTTISDRTHYHRVWVDHGISDRETSRSMVSFQEPRSP